MDEWKAEYDALMLNTQQVIAERDALRQQLEAQTFELNAAKAKLDEQARLHDMMTRDMMTDFMQSATQRECEELRTYNAGLGTERDTLRAQLAALTAERGTLRDHSLELYGTLLCIGEWLRGDLPEASAEQFAAMIDAATGEPRAALAAAPDAE